MKKVLSVLIAIALVCGALVFTACGDSGSGKKSDVDETNLSFSTIGDLKNSGAEHQFIKADTKLEDDMIVCTIKKDASGDLTIPAEYNGKTVVALTAEAEAGDNVTSLTIENGVGYIENCFAGSSKGLVTLTLPAALKAVYSSFNDSALTEVSFPATVKYIDHSFSGCEKLAKIDTNGYVYGIIDSFCEDAALTDAAFNGSIQKIELSFNNVPLSGVSFKENIHDIINSFNDSSALGSVVFDQIAGGVKDSFNTCEKLTTLTYKQGGESIQRSFNTNASLEKVDFGSGVGNISESFRDCPKYTLPEENPDGA